MLRSILLPLEPSIYGLNARNIALRIAAEHEATVTALAVVDRPAIDRQTGPFPMGAGAYVADLREKLLSNIRTGLEKLATALEEEAARRGVKCTVLREEGDPTESIVRESMFHDLVVMGQKSDFDFDGEPDASRHYVLAVLKKGIAPVLMLPREVPERPPETVLVAFNGSLPSARALQRLPMLPWVDKVKVKLLMADAEEAEAAPLLAKAAGYLKSHGVADVESVWTQDSINDALDHEKMGWADIVVAGAHGRSVWDYVLGSVASRLIDQDRCAVLICG